MNLSLMLCDLVFWSILVELPKTMFKQNTVTQQLMIKLKKTKEIRKMM